MTKTKRPGKNAKDLPPKSSTKVRGGGSTLQDNITLVRAGA
jgi:hypothetical protein